jgi:alkanesulfonate monooxygenase SsuD/methylene tetrahydromethanopterin reductase-like flavin-dependent oxidoreductase (luciferase family)
MAFKLAIGLFTGQIPPGSNRTFHEEYSDATDLVRLVEETGLDGAWVSEHHFSADGYLPSVLPILAAFAAVTERIDLGTGVVLAPFHDPVRLAEDFAVVDQISSGRTICGLGIAWREEEFREFNIKMSSRAQRLTEIVEILRLAWTTERFDFSGRYYRLSGVAVMPKPARVPPILIGGFVDEAVRRAGRLGDGYISSRADLKRVEESFEMAARERSEAGLEGPPMVGLLQNAFVTRNPDRDWEMVRAGIAHQLGTYSGWRAGTDVPGKKLEVKPPDEDTIRSTTAYGSPDQVVEYLTPAAELLGRYPESHLVLRVHYPGMDAAPAAESIRLLAGEVAPALRRVAGTNSG